MDAYTLFFGAVFFGLIIAIALGNAKGPPDPKSMSLVALASRIKLEEAWIAKYLLLPLSNRSKPSILKQCEGKKIYLKELQLEFMAKGLVLQGKDLDQTMVPVIRRQIELMRTGISEDDAITQASTEFVAVRDGCSKSEDLESSHDEVDSDMAEPHFLFSNLEDKERISPQKFGYLAIEASEISARSFLKGIEERDINGCFTYMQSFSTYVEILAADTAAHWAYVVYILHVSKPILDEMTIGLDYFLKEAYLPDGRPFSASMIEVFKASFRRYLKAIVNELNSDYEPGDFAPGFSGLSRAFIEAVEHYSFKDERVMAEEEKIYIGQLIAASKPSAVFEGLQQLGLTFNPTSSY